MDNSKSKPNDASPLEDALTVALVVHGVGEQSTGTILRAAQAGLNQFSGGAVTSSEFELDGFPVPGKSDFAPVSELTESLDFSDPDNPRGKQRTLRIQSGDQQHYVIPVVWSGLRVRTGAQPIPFQFGAMVGMALPALVETCWYAMRSIGKSGRLFWGLVVLLGALITLLAVVTAVAGGFYVLINSYQIVTGGQPIKEYIRGPGPFLVLVLVIGVERGFNKLLPLIDLVGDIVCYVGNTRHRAQIEQRIRNILLEVARLAPKARIVIVGHSLGSVVVSHSLLGLPRDPALSSRLVLLTLGSPLRMMSHVFSKTVETPKGLTKRYEQDRVISFWANMWRDSDYVGRSLIGSNSAMFVEQSLGDGLHNDYWSDKRLWQAVATLLERAAQQNLAALANDWRVPDVLNKTEIRESLRRYRQLRVIRDYLVMIAIIPLLAVYEAMRRTDWYSDATPFTRSSIFALVPVICVLFVFIWIVGVIAFIPDESSTGRQLLRRFRFWGDIILPCTKLLVILCAMLAIVLWWAS